MEIVRTLEDSFYRTAISRIDEDHDVKIVSKITEKFQNIAVEIIKKNIEFAFYCALSAIHWQKNKVVINVAVNNYSVSFSLDFLPIEYTHKTSCRI